MDKMTDYIGSHKKAEPTRTSEFIRKSSSNDSFIKKQKNDAKYGLINPYTSTSNLYKLRKSNKDAAELISQ
jgi:hypothetical protein